ncbi:MAG: hypothetical protein BWK73_45365 [Thiothrix lacustris]|uniref:Thioredoxin family protein n=1 Tax=Thiothrix lacustris TaxID=525917 RepID=A0A1Y1QB87_9GAMM|nr:MAG: hypothetical protein BWK73_45365 [Thiothrix lacustris]
MRQRARQQQESEAKIHLSVYHGLGCHLCEEMTAFLREFQNELTFTFLFWYFFDEAILRQALQHG